MGGDELLKACPGATVEMADSAQGMIDLVQGLAQKDERWKGRVHARLMDGVDLDFAAETFDASITNFGIFLFNTPAQGAKELHRTLKPGGKAAVTCWKFVGWRDLLLAEMMGAYFPEKEILTMPGMEKWRNRETLVNCLVEGGFDEEKIEVAEVESPMWFHEQDAAKWRHDMADTIKAMAGSSWIQR